MRRPLHRSAANTGRLDVIGHRGARGLFPENTLGGFKAAASLGILTFELDVGMTADGVVVVYHDQALNPDITRDPSGAWLAQPGPLIWSLTAGDLARYDVGRIRPGSPTSRWFPNQQPHDSARIPTLLAVLAALPDATFIVEVKTDPAHPEQTAASAVLADAVLSVIDRVAAAERVVIASFDWAVPRHVRRIRPEIRLGWLTHAEADRERTPRWGGAGAAGDVRPPATWSLPACVASACGPPATDTWSPHYTDLTEGLVSKAHALGLRVVPWTVNLPADIKRLISWQVDGLISDRPDLALKSASINTSE